MLTVDCFMNFKYYIQEIVVILFILITAKFDPTVLKKKQRSLGFHHFNNSPMLPHMVEAVNSLLVDKL